MSRPNLLRLLPLLALLLPSTPAQAAGPARGGSDELTGWLILGAGYGYHSGYQSGFGLGGRYRLALADGVLRDNASHVRDTFDLEFGGDVVRYAYGYRVAPYHYDYTWWTVRPRVGVMWNFWITPRLALYPKLDLGYELGWFDGWNSSYGGHPGYGGLFLEPTIGLIYRFRPATSLRVELGSEGAKIGLGFAY